MKKAELQMQESILVIFIVTVILGIALFTFYQLQIRSIENSKLELEQNHDLILLSTIQNSVSLGYSYLGSPENSLDTIKLLNPSLENLGFKEIIIKQIYPETQSISCNKQSYPNCNEYVVYSKKPNNIKNTRVISIPVSLYFPYNNEVKPGILELKSYS